jgi:hypothetical protein
MHTLDNFDSATGWAAFNTDCTTVAASTVRMTGTGSMSFAKVNGAANTVFAIIDKTVEAGVNLPEHFFMEDRIGGEFYISDLTNVAYALIRLGSTSANYVEWRFADTGLIAGWNVQSTQIGDAYLGGTGWVPSLITYIAVGVAFDLETHALAGLLWDSVFVDKNQRTVT